MRKLYLLLFFLLSSLTVFSQSTNFVRTDEIVFTDGTKLTVSADVNKENLPLAKDDVNISSKTFQGKILDIGKPFLQVSKNALSTISRKNNSLARQIKRNINGYYLFDQNGKSVTVFGLSSIGNSLAFDKCFETRNCRIECDAVIIQIKVKDKTENIVLIKAIRLLKD